VTPLTRARATSLLLALLIVTVGCAGPTSAPKKLTAPFTRLDGTQASFADYQGRPVVVNFFASTCVPCQTEMPAFEKIHQQLGDKIAFVGIDVQDTVEGGRSFVAAVKVTWDIGRDPNADILSQLGGTGLPTTVVLDRAGTIVFTHLGALDAGTLLDELQKRHLA